MTPNLVVIEVQQWGVCIDNSDVLPPVAVVVNQSKNAAVTRSIDARYSGNVVEVPASGILKEMVTFVTAEGNRRFPAGTDPALKRIIAPLCRTGNLSAKVIVSAHDRAPKAASPVRLRNRDGGRRCVVSTERIDVEKTIVVDIDKLAGPCPASFLDLQRRRLYPRDFLEWFTCIAKQ